jgi:hypothetical protein
MTELSINNLIYKLLKINSLTALFLVIYFYFFNLLVNLFPNLAFIVNEPFVGGLYDTSSRYVYFLMLFNLLIICGVTIYISRRYVKLLYLFLVITFFRVIVSQIIVSDPIYKYFQTRSIQTFLIILIPILFEVGFLVNLYILCDKDLKQETKKLV